jgi:hypothetical protein
MLIYKYTVAEQKCELIIWKIPQNVWVENLRNMLYQLFRQSCLALLLNTSHSFTLLHIICLVSTVVTPT